VKIGDLVLCKHADNIVGLIVGKREGRETVGNRWSPGIFEVLIGVTKYPFREHQLEVISETR